MADETLHVTPAVAEPIEGAKPIEGAEPSAAAPPVRITVKRNGPLRVEGHIILQDADGKEWDLGGKTAVGLCRCGLSHKRPFCDGTHNREGWECDASPMGNLTGQ